MFNATRMEIDPTMEEFLYDMSVSNRLEVPMYYCRLGVYELNSSFLVSFPIVFSILKILIPVFKQK